MLTVDSEDHIAVTVPSKGNVKATDLPANIVETQVHIVCHLYEGGIDMDESAIEVGQRGVAHIDIAVGVIGIGVGVDGVVHEGSDVLSCHQSTGSQVGTVDELYGFAAAINGTDGFEQNSETDCLEITSDITVNKNAIPFDTTKPTVDSGIRLGSAAMTTKGYSEADFTAIGHMIGRVLKNINDDAVKAEVKQQVLALTEAHPFD